MQYSLLKPLINKAIAVTVLAMLTITAVCLVPGEGNRARADVPAFQNAKNRQVKEFTVNYRRLCPNCGNTVGGESVERAGASGSVEFTLSTYKIQDQNLKYDFYFADVTPRWTAKKGDEDWGWMDVTLRNVGNSKDRVSAASHSLGVKNNNAASCRNYPVNLSVSFMGVGGGTTVGDVRLCNPGSHLSTKSVSRGRAYHFTGVSGFASAQMKRYVRVPEGVTPQFEVQAVYNAEYVTCASVSDGRRCFLVRAKSSKNVWIGTTKQR